MLCMYMYCICICIYIYIHTYTYTHTHTQDTVIFFVFTPVRSLVEFTLLSSLNRQHYLKFRGFGPDRGGGTAVVGWPWSAPPRWSSPPTSSVTEGSISTSSSSCCNCCSLPLPTIWTHRHTNRHISTVI